MPLVEDLADPRRCKGASPGGQCRNVAAYGSDYCPEAHRGKSTEQAESKRMYLLAKAADRARLVELSGHDEVKSLREEIALARMLIEQRFNLIKTDLDLLNACGPLNNLLLTVDRLVKSAHNMEQSLGLLLDKSSILQLSLVLCQIVIDELEGIDDYQLIVDRITERFAETIGAANNPHASKPLLLTGPSD
jgi:hypothetical protein